jgi:hypothetical protein
MIRGVEPPNLYAAILDSQYAETSYSDNDRIWITARINDMTVVGSLYRYSLSQTPREIELKNVVYYALDGTITELPVDASVIIRVDDAYIIEIRHVAEE